MTSGTPYSRSAEFYDVIYDFKDFPETSARLLRLIDDHSPNVRSILDVGCGTGRHLELLGSRFERVGIDLSEDMLSVARARCPDVEFHHGDMATTSLGRHFDVVCCLFSAVAYVGSVARLRDATRLMADHLAPGGLLLIEPWFSPETFWQSHLAVNFAERGELKVSWMYAHKMIGGISRFDIHYLVGSPDGVEHIEERHDMGLFTEADYEDAIRSAGLEPHYAGEGLFGRGLYTAVKAR